MSSRPATPPLPPRTSRRWNSSPAKSRGPPSVPYPVPCPPISSPAARLWPRRTGPVSTPASAPPTSTSGKFQDERYGKTLADKKIRILRMAVDAVKLARQFADDVEFYAEDAGRAEPAYLFEMIAAAIDAGATVVNIPDTTGYT